MGLAKNVLTNVHGISTAKAIWEELEELYQTTGASNRVYLKEQFHTLQIKEDTSISDHLSILNGIVSELESIGVKIDDEDQVLRLIWSLPPFYEHMKPILIHGKEKIIFSEVTSKFLIEERKLVGGKNNSSENLILFNAAEKSKNFTRKKVGVCWMCRQSRHVKKNCPKGGASSTSGSRSVDGDTDNNSNIISLSPWEMIFSELRQVRPYGMSLSCHNRGYINISGSTNLHMGIGLTLMQGGGNSCRWLMNFRKSQMWRLHYKFSAILISTWVEVKCLELFYSECICFLWWSMIAKVMKNLHRNGVWL